MSAGKSSRRRASSMRQVASLEPGDAENVERFLEELLQRSQLPGISVAMNVKGKTLVAAAGTADRKTGRDMTTETRFPLRGMTALLIALVVLEFVASGRLILTRAVASYLPELSGRLGDHITLQHLLTNTAGYQGLDMNDPDVLFDLDYDSFAESFNRRRLLFTPGTVFDLNLVNAVLLVKVLEVVSGQAFSALIDEIIFKPLDIPTMAVHELSDVSVGHSLNLLEGGYRPVEEVPVGEFWSQVLGDTWIRMADLVKVGAALMLSTHVFSPEARKLLCGRQVSLPGLFVVPNTGLPFYCFGLGCMLYPQGMHGHCGNLFNQCCKMVFDMKRRIAISVAMNAEEVHVRDYVVAKLFNSMLPEDAPVIKNLDASPAARFRMEDLIGIYEGSEGHRFLIDVEDNKLKIRIGHNSSTDRGAGQVMMQLGKAANGNLALEKLLYPVSFGFHRDRAHGNGIVLRVGVNSYRRVAD